MTEPQWENVEIGRDRFGRPLVMPPEGGTPIPYTRCTTYVGVMEDTYNLGKWQQRMVATGLSQRPDLLLRASSLGPQPEDDRDARGWKKEMGDVCEGAIEAAKGSAAATVGTALHKLTEKLDRGEALGFVPDQYKPHLRAYEEATRAFEAVHIEVFTVLDELQIGGTPDRVLRIPGYDKLIIGDVKTGSVEYGTGKMAMQLAVYAHSLLYDIPTGQRSPIGDVDLERGVIVALNAKTGKCDLKWIDIGAGWQAMTTATEVRRWRAKRNWTRPFDQASVDERGEVIDLTKAAASALKIAIVNADTPDQLIELWRKAGNVWTDEHSAFAAQRKRELTSN